MASLPQVDPVATAIAKLAERLLPLESESCAAEQVHGRVLAEPLLADRDSPAVDVSAMDGYAVRISDLNGASLPVASVAAAGHMPQLLPTAAAIKIFTGAAVPQGANCVVRREDTIESPSEVTFTVPATSLKPGQNIRYRGENGQCGEVVLPKGYVINPMAMSAIATFAPVQVLVHKRVRVAVLNTGDELAGIGETIEAWKIRDSNGPMLESWLREMPWVEFIFRKHVGDQLATVQAAIAESLPQVDAILLTGGVSMGDADFVPEAIEKLGGETTFHRLPIRPGKPVLGAALNGKLLLGLPGNPVSVAVTSRVIGLPLLRKLAGILPLEEPMSRCLLSDTDTKSLPLIWYRLVKSDSNSAVRLVGSQGSGDLVSLAQSDGFIEVPSGHSGAGPWLMRWW